MRPEGLNAVCFYLQGLLRNESNKIVVYGSLLSMFDAIEDILNLMNVKCIRIDGKMSLKRRYALVKTFQRKESCRYAIISEKSVGLVLDKANV